MMYRPKTRPLTDRENEIAALAEFMKNRTVTKLPPAAAAVMGEATPGWRHNQDRFAEYKSRVTKDRAATNSEQVRIADRISAPRVSSKNRVREKIPGSHVVMCQFFDKRCILRGFDNRGEAERWTQFFADKYGVIGARFFIVFGVPPTQVSWKVTVKPLLERQLGRHHIKQIVNDDQMTQLAQTS